MQSAGRRQRLGASYRRDFIQHLVEAGLGQDQTSTARLGRSQHSGDVMLSAPSVKEIPEVVKILESREWPAMWKRGSGDTQGRRSSH